MTNDQNRVEALPLNLYTAEQVRNIDRLAIEQIPVDGYELMYKAGQFAFDTLRKVWSEASKVTVFCGSGNNGGDGYVIAALARISGLEARVISLSDPKNLKNSAAKAYAFCKDQDIEVSAFETVSSRNLLPLSDRPDHILVDALLGTGLNQEVSGSFRLAIELINQTSLPTMAIDIPSGLSADTGAVLGCAVKADCTASFIGLKVGMFTGKGRDYSGTLYFSELDVPSHILALEEPMASRLDYPSLLPHIAPRSRSAHKGTYGHSVLVGGNISYCGAISLAAEACARMGAGLTSVATRQTSCTVINQRCPEVMATSVEHATHIKPALAKATCLAIGPGLGQDAWAQQMLQATIESQCDTQCPLIMDADALNLIAESDVLKIKLEQAHQGLRLITPHPGEAARLLETTTVNIEADRLAAARKLSERFQTNVILKGSGTVIQLRNGKSYICPYGNPGMASGGMGDTLTGMLAGILAQWPDSFGILLAVCLHALAADKEAELHGERGLLASDLIPRARRLLNGLND